MENSLHFTLKPSTIESLQTYTQILDKDVSLLIEEALDAYFAEVQKGLLEKNIADENALTNLGYDEFWDGVEL